MILPIFQLNTSEILFPDIDYAEKNGLIAIGGDLSVQRLILAYESGIFPWYSDGQPILWWSPNPRHVILTDKVHISHSMKRLLRNTNWKFRINTSPEKVISECSSIPRTGESGTWITDEMKTAYLNLNQVNRLISFETWHNEELIGGMYGVLCKNYFAGESMFSKVSNASKFALINACKFLHDEGITLLDGQIHSDHLESMGAIPISRKVFRKFLSY